MSSIRIAAACLGLLLAGGVRADVKVYDVDFKYQQEVYVALREVLVADPAQAVVGGMAAYGRVQLLPTGQILVDARPETHEQIERLLAAVAARQVDVPPPPRARFRYWVVLGSRAAESGGDPAPSVLSEVLGELERVHGNLTFSALGTATLVTESGQEGEVLGHPLAVAQTAHVQGETASAEIRIRLLIVEPPRGGAAFSTERETEQELELDVTLERGEFLVLGENTVRTPGGIDGTLFYIVHWPAGE